MERAESIAFRSDTVWAGAACAATNPSVSRTGFFARRMPRRRIGTGAIIVRQVHGPGFGDETAKLNQMPRSLSLLDLCRITGRDRRT